MTLFDPLAFIRANTSVVAPPHVPEIQLHLADEAHDLWKKTEEELGAMGVEPPFWAFAWAGGQALARYILDEPHHIAGKTVFDFATGSGLVAIAAAKAGATEILANDIDTMCGPAIAANAAINDCEIAFTDDIMLGDPLDGFDVVLAGDVFFDAAMSAAVEPWLESLSKAGKTVLIGDPQRHYLPKNKLTRLATYQVKTTKALEDMEIKRTSVWQFS